MMARLKFLVFSFWMIQSIFSSKNRSFREPVGFALFVSTRMLLVMKVDALMFTFFLLSSLSLEASWNLWRALEFWILAIFNLLAFSQSSIYLSSFLVSCVTTRLL